MERADLGQASTIIEHKKAVTIDDVRADLEAMKKEAVEVKIEEL